MAGEKPGTTGMCPVSAGPWLGPVRGRCPPCLSPAGGDECVLQVWSKENFVLLRGCVIWASSLLTFDYFYFGKTTSPVWAPLPCRGKQGGMKPSSGFEPRKTRVRALCHPFLAVPDLPPPESADVTRGGGEHSPPHCLGLRQDEDAEPTRRPVPGGLHNANRVLTHPTGPGPPRGEAPRTPVTHAHTRPAAPSAQASCPGKETTRNSTSTS